MTSSTTLSFVWRRRLVRQRMRIVRLSSSSISASSAGSTVRSRLSRRSAISSSRSRVLCRLTSVGWAVSTGLTSAVSKNFSSASGATPISRVRWNEEASEPGRGAEPAIAWARLRRM